MPTKRSFKSTGAAYHADPVKPSFNAVATAYPAAPSSAAIKYSSFKKSTPHKLLRGFISRIYIHKSFG